MSECWHWPDDEKREWIPSKSNETRQTEALERIAASLEKIAELMKQK